MWNGLGNLGKCVASQDVDENKYHSYGQHWRLAFDIAINIVSIIMFIYFFFWSL